MMLEIQNLTVAYGSKTIVDDVSFSVSEGDWLMLAGPNGAGKSTIVHAISQGTPYRGQILFDGKNLASFKPAERAQSLGILSQHHNVGYSFTVEEVVRLGRYAYARSMFSARPEEEEQAVQEALALTGMQKLAQQSILTLSGGELQRTFLAQLFAQNPKLLILDEPTNHLDLVYQKQVFGLLQKWLQTPGRAVVSVVHDLNLAKAYGSHALLLSNGKKAAFGTADEVFNRENLQKVYQLDVYAFMNQMLSQWKK